MIKLIFTLLSIVSLQTANAQLRILERAKQNVKNKVDQKVMNGVDKTIDKADTVITGKKGNSSNTGKDKKNESTDMTDAKESNPSQSGVAIKANSKFDFIPGEKIIASEDFSQDAMGDFPDKWNTSSSGEVVTIDGQKGKWLALKKPGVFYPEYINNLPENFTLEYDIAASTNYTQGSASFDISIITVADDNELKSIVNNSGDRFRPSNNTTGITIKMHPNDYNGGSFSYRILENGGEQLYRTDKQNIFTNKNNIVHVSIWRQKTRIRMYINQEKILDLPKVMTGAYSKIIFSPHYSYSSNDDMLYLTNIRLASGQADTRNKLITEGKFVTRGILFESGSDKINPQSYGVLKEIAGVLSESGDVRVKIIGHTDSDGDNAANLSLSKKRAEAVKNVLTNNFNIDATRMDASGKGETEPVEPNTSMEGKANNRRVEFIKL